MRWAWNDGPDDPDGLTSWSTPPGPGVARPVAALARPPVVSSAGQRPILARHQAPTQTIPIRNNLHRASEESAMKLLWFHPMPYTELPDDFARQHRSVCWSTRGART